MTEELRNHIEAFVCGHISLAQFHVWLTEWLAPRFRDTEFSECVGFEIDCQVLMALQHIGDGVEPIETEEDLKAQLSEYLPEPATTSSNRTLRMRWGLT